MSAMTPLAEFAGENVAMIARSIRRATSLPSISRLISSRSMPEPWLWPMSTKGRPLLCAAR